MANRASAACRGLETEVKVVCVCGWTWFHSIVFAYLGSGLIDHSQNMTAAAMQIAEK